MKYKQRENSTIDSDYEYYAGREHLYGKAFFGHKKTRNERRKLNYIWKRLLKQYYYTDKDMEKYKV